ncbi:MAG: hypothetical protein R3F60_13985 [bacterium]
MRTLILLALATAACDSADGPGEVVDASPAPDMAAVPADADMAPDADPEQEGRRFAAEVARCEGAAEGVDVGDAVEGRAPTGYVSQPDNAPCWAFNPRETKMFRVHGPRRRALQRRPGGGWRTGWPSRSASRPAVRRWSRRPPRPACWPAPSGPRPGSSSPRASRPMWACGWSTAPTPAPWATRPRLACACRPPGPPGVEVARLVEDAGAQRITIGLIFTDPDGDVQSAAGGRFGDDDAELYAPDASGISRGVDLVIDYYGPGTGDEESWRWRSPDARRCGRSRSRSPTPPARPRRCGRQPLERGRQVRQDEQIDGQAAVAQGVARLGLSPQAARQGPLG